MRLMLLLVMMLLPCAATAAEPRPNVLLIAVDDLNDWVGCLHGHPQALTPNLDRLAARGVLFANAHCQAPLCNPSRTSLLFGRRPGTTGVYGLAPAPRQVDSLRTAQSLPQCFAAAGYHTATSGKIYHDSEAMPLAAEFSVVGTKGQVPYPEHKLVTTPNAMKAVDWGPFEADERKHADWQIAEAAIAQLRDRPRDRPFFIATGFRYPHLPCFAPPAWFDRFPAVVTLPEVPPNDRDDVPSFAWYLHWRLPGLLRDGLARARRAEPAWLLGHELRRASDRAGLGVAPERGRRRAELAAQRRAATAARHLRLGEEHVADPASCDDTACPLHDLSTQPDLRQQQPDGACERVRGSGTVGYRPSSLRHLR